MAVKHVPRLAIHAHQRRRPSLRISQRLVCSFLEQQRHSVRVPALCCHVQRRAKECSTASVYVGTCTHTYQINAQLKLHFFEEKRLAPHSFDAAGRTRTVFE